MYNIVTYTDECEYKVWACAPTLREAKRQVRMLEQEHPYEEYEIYNLIKFKNFN